MTPCRRYVSCDIDILVSQNTFAWRQGDLDDILGPIYDSNDDQSAPPGVLPNLSLTSQHPYHLLVV